MKRALVVCILLCATVFADNVDTDESDGMVTVSTSKPRVTHPTRGFVAADMVDELPTPSDNAGQDTMQYSLLHPNPISTTTFSSEAILGSADQAERDAAELAEHPFIPEVPAQTQAEAQALPTDSYIEVDGVSLLTETERAAMEEQRSRATSFVETSLKGSRKYMIHYNAGNTGKPLARFPKQTPASCMDRCNGETKCVGFTIIVDKKAREQGLCTLRESWGSSVENPNIDSYQAHDFSTDNLPYKSLEAKPKLTAEQSLFLMADVSRIRPQQNQKTVELSMTVDGDYQSSIWTNVARHYRGSESYQAPSFQGITPSLSEGEHTVKLQWTRSKAVPVQGNDESGCQQQRLTAIPFPIELDKSRTFDVIGTHWNIAVSSNTDARKWAAIPGGRELAGQPEDDQNPNPPSSTEPMRIEVAVPNENYRLFVMGDISRVQHGNGWTNSAFRLTVDGKPIGYTNTGEHYGWQYRAVSVRAASEKLTKGPHTIEMQVRTQRGKAYFINDGNGFQQRRLTAMVIPNEAIWNQNWNLATSYKKTRKWSRLPAADMKLTINSKLAGFAFATVSVSRVQSWGTDNVQFRLMMDGKEIARHNTGSVNGWKFHDIVFHGATTEVIPPGEHTFHVEFKSRAGSTVVFYNDANGWQQRRLTAIIFPAHSGFTHIKQFTETEEGYCKNMH